MAINRALNRWGDARCSAWREQPAHQLGSLSESPLRGRGCRGDFDFDLVQHPRQRDGEREEGSVQIGGRSLSTSCDRLAGRCQRRAGAGSCNVSQVDAGFFPSRVLYPPHSRQWTGHNNSAYFGGGSRLWSSWRCSAMVMITRFSAPRKRERG
jgi:hypothetical protein